MPELKSRAANGAPKAATYNIAAALRGLMVPIDSLSEDPRNAKLHPEDNMEAIRASLTRYGQLKPIVVRKETRHIVAGNGTYRAAKELGWTHIAANVSDLSELEAVGYGLTDNITSELGRWDYKTKAELAKYLHLNGEQAIGMTSDEVKILFNSMFTPPPLEETYSGGGEQGSQNLNPLTVTFTAEEKEVVDRAIAELRDRLFSEGEGESLDDPACIARICSVYLGESA